MCALACDMGDMGGDFHPPCDPCPRSCDACQAPPEFPPCPPGGGCDCRCDCGDFARCCYQQPPRQLPIRPPQSTMRSNAPVEKDTIYKLSYYPNCGDCYRQKPFRPTENLQPSSGARMESCTVQKLSYMPPCGAVRAYPMKPHSNGLSFKGPYYAMTSMKHDYVPKGYSKRAPIVPFKNVMQTTEPLECRTINKLSYMPVDVCANPPRKPIRQENNIGRNTGPTESCTIQKLSYLPVCMPKKEPMPWADKQRCAPPVYGNLCTTYNLSYMPNCSVSRVVPTKPLPALQYLGTDSTDGHTVYKLSYMPVDARCCRAQPIKPPPSMEMPTGPMEKCTIQKLSYQPTCSAQRTLPIRPPQSNIKMSGPIYSMTTQKHDFVPKPILRRVPIRQLAMIGRATGPVEYCTVNKLSYMPVDFCQHPRRQAIRPNQGTIRSDAPIDKCTTYKLSYLPNCVQARQPLRNQRIDSFERPTGPPEKCTIQKLSYGPPGNFSRCGGCCNPSGDAAAFPKAGICN